MRKVSWSRISEEEFNDWENKDIQVFEKIGKLILDIQSNPFKGIGKPEPLKHHLKGSWSRRINHKHRLIYRISSNDEIHIISCKGHYD